VGRHADVWQVVFSREKIPLDPRQELCSIFVLLRETRMDWTENIEKNRQALIAILAGLVAVVQVTVLREIKLKVLRVLRPAESAVRRLIVIAARGLVLKPAVSRPMPPGLSKRLRLKRKERTARPVFQLADPFMPMVEPRRRRYAKHGPRIFFIPPADPTIAAIFAPPSAAPTVAETPVDTSAALKRRLEAIQLALGDLPKQARRLLRCGPF
jgi:hypothetical protein